MNIPPQAPQGDAEEAKIIPQGGLWTNQHFGTMIMQRADPETLTGSKAAPAAYGAAFPLSGKCRDRDSSL